MKKMIIMFFLLLLSSFTYAHCEIPCGIYDDNRRVMEMLEDVATIQKSVEEMEKLYKEDDLQSKNQFNRWVVNKEEHAQKIIDTISNYFLTQRVKESQNDYEERLKKHHKVIVEAMHTKQNATIESVLKLKTAVANLAKYYPKHTH